MKIRVSCRSIQVQQQTVQVEPTQICSTGRAKAADDRAVTERHITDIMNLPYAVFALLVFGVPIYERYERTHYPNDGIPTRLKWTAQMALGSTTAANSVCRIFSVMRQRHGTGASGPSPDGKAVSGGANHQCLVLGVTVGGMSTAYMQGSWDENDWAYVQDKSEKIQLWNWGKESVGASSEQVGEGSVVKSEQDEI